MGSGSSKVVIKKVENVDYSAVNSVVEADEALNTEKEIPPSDDCEPVQENNNQINENINVEISQTPTQEEIQENEVKPVSETLKETEEKLKEKGITDSVLASYCDETPSLFDDFVTLFENVGKIKRHLKDEDFVSSFGTYFRRISNLYEKNRPEKIKKGNLLAEIGFAEVCKDVLDKTTDAFPKLMTYDREEDEVCLNYRSDINATRIVSNNTLQGAFTCTYCK